MTDDAQPTYRFRWVNIDLERFVEGRRAAATALRRQAEILVRRAEQIEEECAEWQTALEVVKGK